MSRQAQALATDQGKRTAFGKRADHARSTRTLAESNYSINLDFPDLYSTLRRHYYEAVLDEALDDIARQAMRLSSAAGHCEASPDMNPEACQMIRGMAHGVRDRLLERCMAYEVVLRTVDVPERQVRR